MIAKANFNIDPNEFKGKKILVTAGTKGAGKAIFERLLKSGASIITTARTQPADIDPANFIQADLSIKTGTDKVVKKRLNA